MLVGRVARFSLPADDGRPSSDGHHLGDGTGVNYPRGGEYIQEDRADSDDEDNVASTPPEEALSSSELGEQVNYCLPIQVRNTFIEVAEERSPSLERFLAKRQVRSSPPSGALEIAEPIFLDPVFPTTWMMQPPLASVGSARAGTYKEEEEEATTELDAELPSTGSISHRTGSCKPCAFGPSVCLNGSSCLFCHICDPSEIQKRKKLKLALRKQAQADLKQPKTPRSSPSWGSIAHETGRCKPCAFGPSACVNGSNCQFCHICDPSEVQNRNTLRLARRKQAQANQKANGVHR